MKAAFKDHFSGHAAAYAAHRPHYPLGLVAALAKRCGAQRCALDCGCGSGQLAILLAERFAQVHAIDPSAEQIAHAVPHERVRYAVAMAEHTGMADRSADLVVAAQAVHWFDAQAFWQEVRRVSAPGGLCALVAYGLSAIEPPIDERVRRFHDVELARYWPPERMSVMRGYRDLAFPFPEVPGPAIEMTCRWTCAEFLEYVGTWSGVKAAQRAGAGALFSALRDDLLESWGPPERVRVVRWPLVLRLGRVE